MDGHVQREEGQVPGADEADAVVPQAEATPMEEAAAEAVAAVQMEDMVPMAEEFAAQVEEPAGEMAPEAQHMDLDCTAAELPAVPMDDTVPDDGPMLAAPADPDDADAGTDAGQDSVATAEVTDAADLAAAAAATAASKDPHPSLLELLLLVSQQQHLQSSAALPPGQQATGLPPLPLASTLAPNSQPATVSFDGTVEGELRGGDGGTAAQPAQSPFVVSSLVLPSNDKPPGAPNQQAHALSISFLLPLLQQLQQTINQNPQLGGAKPNPLLPHAAGQPARLADSSAALPSSSAGAAITIPPLPTLPHPSPMPSSHMPYPGMPQQHYHPPPRHPGPAQPAENYFCIKERNQGGLWCGRVLVTAKDCKRFPDDLRNQTQLCTSGFSTPAEAAKAVDSLLYLLGRTDKLNFSMSMDERSALDALGLGGLMAVFRNANKRATHGYFGISRVNSEGGKWRGRVHVSPSERSKFADELPDQQKQLMTNYYESAAEAAKAVDRILFALGRIEKLNFPMSDDERAALQSLGLGGVMAEFRRGSHGEGKTSLFRGVFRNDQKSGWVSSIFYSQRSVHLGTYQDEEEAARAYDEAAHSLGFTDKLNFPAEAAPPPNSHLLMKLFGTDDPMGIAAAKASFAPLPGQRGGARKRGRPLKVVSIAGEDGGGDEEEAPFQPGSHLGYHNSHQAGSQGDGAGPSSGAPDMAAAVVPLGSYGQQLLEGFMGSLQTDGGPAPMQGQVSSLGRGSAEEAAGAGEEQACGSHAEHAAAPSASEHPAGPYEGAQSSAAAEGAAPEDGVALPVPSSGAGGAAPESGNTSLLGQLTHGLQLELNNSNGMQWHGAAAAPSHIGQQPSSSSAHPEASAHNPLAQLQIVPLDLQALIGAASSHMDMEMVPMGMSPDGGGSRPMARGLQQQRQGSFPGVTCGVSGRWQGRAYIAASEHKLLPDHLQCLSALTTNTFDSDVEAAKALDRLLYTLGRVDKLNFPLSDDERAALDALGVGGVVAAFRREGSCRPSIRGKVSQYRGVTQCPSSARWRGLITLKRKSIHLGTFETEDAAARAYDQAARALGYLDKLNFPDEGVDSPMSSKIQVKLFGTDDPEKVRAMQAASFTPTYSRRNRKSGGE